MQRSSPSCLQRIADNSKIFTNIGIIHASLGEHEAAVEAFTAAISLDSYLSIAYFLTGISNFLIGRFDTALLDFEVAFKVMRGHKVINYEQLGLKYKLYGAAVLFNQGIIMINLGNQDCGMQLLKDALALDSIDDHDVIADAIENRGHGHTLLCIPARTLYRPNEKKIANMRPRDWMGKALLISPINSPDELTAFASPKRFPPPRPDPPPPRVRLSRTRSVMAVGSISRPQSAIRIARRATVDGLATLPPWNLGVSLTLTKWPVVASPPETPFVASRPPQRRTLSDPLPLPLPKPLLFPRKAKSQAFSPAGDGELKVPLASYHPTIKMEKKSVIESPPSSPSSQQSEFGVRIPGCGGCASAGYVWTKVSVALRHLCACGIPDSEDDEGEFGQTVTYPDVSVSNAIPDVLSLKLPYAP
ncbi:hypothetical protein FRB97_009360 [Tulasnella sp. 331]|nr:hypothetical protein FRB97_009360 [Tulasnella sp. 331]